MKKIYEYNGKIYVPKIGEPFSCEGCAFQIDRKCTHDVYNEEMDCTSHYNGLGIFVELKPEEGKP